MKHGDWLQIFALGFVVLFVVPNCYWLILLAGTLRLTLDLRNTPVLHVVKRLKITNVESSVLMCENWTDAAAELELTNTTC